MKTTQLKIVKLAGIALVAALLYPPWVYTFQYNGITKKAAGYSLLFSPPPPEYNDSRCGVQIDYGKLTIEFVVIFLITGISFIVIKEKNTNA